MREDVPSSAETDVLGVGCGVWFDGDWEDDVWRHAILRGEWEGQWEEERKGEGGKEHGSLRLLGREGRCLQGPGVSGSLNQPVSRMFFHSGTTELRRIGARKPMASGPQVGGREAWDGDDMGAGDT